MTFVSRALNYVTVSARKILGGSDSNVRAHSVDDQREGSSSAFSEGAHPLRRVLLSRTRVRTSVPVEDEEDDEEDGDGGEYEDEEEDDESDDDEDDDDEYMEEELYHGKQQRPSKQGRRERSGTGDGIAAVLVGMASGGSAVQPPTSVKRGRGRPKVADSKRRLLKCLCGCGGCTTYNRRLS